MLKQVAVPHPYYWREMYVPQVTGGPTSLTWSPDGAEVIYSMAGSLWRQRVDSPVARQLTDGPGYDHQPDWSPDGRRVVFTRYHADALELHMLDLDTGMVSAASTGGAVNLDPRWSPDGTKLAFVSSRHEGRWHIFLAPVNEGVPGDAVRLTADHVSPLPRYYYSRWDQYLSPVWSPDGREILFVGNRGHIHGSGGFWRMEARSGASMREIRYEETTWKARADFSPDGRRVVYPSYLGRQWHQLWLMTGEGGDPMPLTYGDFDATAPRWSRDGSRIAFISNEEGNTALRVIEIVGGRVTRVEARERQSLRPEGMLRLEIVDAATGKPTPARVSVTGPDGRGWVAKGAWLHADEAFDRSERPFEYTYFHADGEADLTLPPGGPYAIEVSRGPEYAPERFAVTIVASAGAPATRVVLRRLADLSASGWISGDLHVHMNYGGAYRNTPERLVMQARAEGLRIVESLVVNKEQRVPDIAYFRTTPDPASRPDMLLMHGQEFHTSIWGHMGVLGLTGHYLMPDYAGYPNTAVASLAFDNVAVADLARQQGALTGYVHPFDTLPDPSDRKTPLANALPVNVALGKSDYFEVMGFSDHLATSEVWYRLLNCGFPLPSGAGTDAFPNFASLRGPAGLLRVFARSGETMGRSALPDHTRFLEALKAGRTFVTNGPLLELTVDGRGPGETLSLPAGRQRLRAKVSMTSYIPIDHLEIVQGGRVVADVPLAADRMSASAAIDLDVESSAWIVLRARSDKAVAPVLDLYPFASTSPVFVTLGGAPIRSAKDAAWFVAWLDRVAETASSHTGWNTPQERKAVLDRIAQARGIFVARGGGEPMADLVVLNADIRTLDDAQPRARALAVKNGRLIHVGDADGARALAGPGTEVVDMGGALLLPGFRDAHVHPIGSGSGLGICFLAQAKTREALFAALRACASTEPKRPWLIGDGYNQALFPEGRSDRKDLDAIISDRPAILYAGDGGHSAWVNTKALEAAGVSRATPDPPGGVIEREASTREATGMLREAAVNLVAAKAPKPTREELLATLAGVLGDFTRLGLVSIQDASASENEVEVWLEAARRKMLTVRVRLALLFDDEQDPAMDDEQIAKLIAARTRIESDPEAAGRLVPGAVKLFLDGVIEGGTAALLSPYLPFPGKAASAGVGDPRGLPNYEPTRLNRIVERLDKAGFQIHMHAIGDRGIRMGLDALEEARRANGPRDARHHLAHIQLIHPDDQPRFARLGAVANFQAYWANADPYITELTEPVLGPERSRWLYPIGSILATGARVACGSDWSVTTVNPLDAIQVAVTRQPLDGSVPTWMPEERASLPAMLDACTLGGAFVNFEDDSGALIPGHRADFIALDRDLFSIPASEIHRARVTWTVVGGETVYRSEGAQ